ncbi:MAG: hypothetical protein K5877_04545, partial [Lachnospiraceae bacterium]|nr:hypothetical protein [Lachnospiraceae bacterium]
MQKDNNISQNVSFRKQLFRAIPEIWIFQVFLYLILAVPAFALLSLIDWVAGLGGKVVTTANILGFLLSWKLPVMLVLIFLLVLVYMVIELFSQIFFTERILKGEKAGI